MRGVVTVDRSRLPLGDAGGSEIYLDSSEASSVADVQNHKMPQNFPLS